MLRIKMETPPNPPLITGGASLAGMLLAGTLSLALVAGPARADVKQIKLGVKGATCAT
jgi:hypothetical protein